MADTTATLRARLRAALPAAMKARDRAAVAALRSALAAIDNAEAVAPEPEPEPVGDDSPIAKARVGLGAGEAARHELTDDDVAAIVRAEVAERLTSADEYDDHGRDERADRLRAEAAVLQAHLSA
jgi:uncharacterized protein YqeY